VCCGRRVGIRGAAKCKPLACPVAARPARSHGLARERGVYVTAGEVAELDWTGVLPSLAA
jgi:hypothetical protein